MSHRSPLRPAAALPAALLAAAILLLALTVSARAMPLGPGAFAATHAGTGHSARARQAGVTRLATLGFNPKRNGFAFQNYGNTRRVSNLTAIQLQGLFGAGVCLSGSGASCVLTPPAQKWMDTQNAIMADGHCEGFSVGSLLVFKGVVAPNTLGGRKIRLIHLAGNAKVQNFIAYAYVFQTLKSVQRKLIWNTDPLGIVHRLIDDLHQRQRQWSIHIFMKNGTEGHAITPIAVDEIGAREYGIEVYDNNFPDTTRTIIVDRTNDTWHYMAASNPKDKAALYVGTKHSDTLQLEDMSPGIGTQPCPFCKSAKARGAHAASALTSDGDGDVFVGLTTQPGSHSHLLINGGGGRKVGFTAGGQFVNHFAGTRVTQMTSGGPTPWNTGLEPEYNLPSGQPLSVQVTGQQPAQASQPVGVSLVGPGTDVGVSGISNGTALSVPAALDGIAVQTPAGQTQSPTLTIGAVGAGGAYSYSVTASGVPGSGTVGATITGSGNLAVIPPASGGGTVAVTVTHTDTTGTSQTFTNSDVPTQPGQTTTIGTAGYSGGSVTVQTGAAAPVTLPNQNPSSPPAPPATTPTTPPPATTTTTTTATTPPPTTTTTATTPPPTTTTTTTTPPPPTTTTTTPPPPVVSSPTLTAVTPSTIDAGASSAAVTLTGSGFAAGAVVTVSNPGVSVLDSTVVSSTEIDLHLAVGARSATGAADVTVENADGGAVTDAGALQIDDAPSVNLAGRANGYASDVTATPSLAAFLPLSDTTTDTVAGGPLPTGVNTTNPGGDGVWGDTPTRFDGTDGYVSLDGNPWATATAWTWEGWLRWDGPGVGAWQRVFDLGDDTDDYVMFTAGSGDSDIPRVEINIGGNKQYADFPVALPTGSWQQLAVSVDAGGNVTFYLDGVELQPSGGPVSFSQTPAEIGETTNNWLGRSQFDADAYLGGEEQDVAFYTDAVPASTIADHFAQASPASPADVPAGAAGEDITITGSGFESGATVSFADPDITVTGTRYVESRELVATVSVAAGAQPGDGGFTVQNPDGTSVQSPVGLGISP